MTNMDSSCHVLCAGSCRLGPWAELHGGMGGPRPTLSFSKKKLQRSPLHDRPNLERSRQQPSEAIHRGRIDRKRNDGRGGIERAAPNTRVTHNHEMSPALPPPSSRLPPCRAEPPAPSLLPLRLLFPCWLLLPVLLPPRLLLAYS
jgi:hypothetical protein